MKAFIAALLCLIVVSIKTQGQTSEAYIASIKHFDSMRIKALTEEDGWLNLAGLFWLHPGENSFGSSNANAVVFKHKNMPQELGKFIVASNTVSFEFNKAVTKFSNDYAEEVVCFDADKKINKSLTFHQFKWSIIKREDKIGVRFRDLKNPALANFKGIKRFTINEKWNLPAKLLPPDPSGLFITNVLGQTTAQDYAGKISFEYEGKNYV